MPSLWSHQRSQSSWLASRPFAYLNGGMGTGKSATAIDATRNDRSVLVVCPIAVGPAWLKQYATWDSSREVCLAVDGPTARRAERVSRVGDGRCVVVVNYDGVWRGDLGKQIQKMQWDAIVLDEAHRIKSPSGRASRWLSRLAEAQPAARRVCLSGTPTPHSPLDWWAQMRFLEPTILGGSYTGFRARIANTHPKFPGFVTSFKPDAIEAMTRRLDDHVYRVTADEVLSLPESMHIDIPVVLAPKTRKYYDALETEMTAVIEDSGKTVTAANGLVVITRLQQATSGYAVSDDEQTVQIGNEKQQAFQDWLQDLPESEPIVVFCKFRADIHAVCRSLDSLGRSHSVLMGGKNQLAQWQDGATTALVVQIQAGGCGIDATRACYAAYYSQTHSLGDFEQSLARLNRPGQSRPCRFFHFVAEDTIDREIYDALQSKRDVVDSVFSRLTRRSLA